MATRRSAGSVVEGDVDPDVDPDVASARIVTGQRERLDRLRDAVVAGEGRR